jgi:hypothetical protein
VARLGAVERQALAPADSVVLRILCSICMGKLLVTLEVKTRDLCWDLLEIFIVCTVSIQYRVDAGIRNCVLETALLAPA